MLRLVSFGMDRYWATNRARSSSSSSSDSVRLSFNCLLLQQETDAFVKPRSPSFPDLEDFSYSNYLIYILYPPLFLAGPIMTYSSFIFQLKTRPSIPSRSVLAYALRFAVCFLTMEVVLHWMYVVAIKDSWVLQKAAGGGEQWRKYAWMDDTPFELAMISLWNLIIVWLKVSLCSSFSFLFSFLFLVIPFTGEKHAKSRRFFCSLARSHLQLLLPWRFFRLWALLDSFDPPENMVRCVLNNYSTRGFWRAWHRSYNLYLLRYIYVPISTATRSNVLAMLVVFTFVALWHDLSLHLLAWGWLTVFFALPEILASQVLPMKKVSPLSVSTDK